MQELSDRERLLALLVDYGWNATSFQALEPGFSYWFSDDGRAGVAYVRAARCWVAAGAPICAAERLGDVALAFVRAASASGCSAAFFGAEERLLDALPQCDWLQVGIQACWDPRIWSTVAAASSTVASQVRRAARKGLQVREAASVEFAEHTPLRRAAEELMARWLDSHPIAPMQFLVDLDAFSRADRRRYFVGYVGARLVGLLVAVPVYARGGWLLEDLISDAEAPNGTAESLVDVAMRHFESEEVPYATMGLVALAHLQERRHPHGSLEALMRLCYDRLNWAYGFSGLYRFRSKFKPNVWEPIYVVSHTRVTLLTILAVLMAFAGGKPGEFLRRSALKLIGGGTFWWLVPQLLAAALVPWTILLLRCDSERWFGTAWLSLAWASFDALVAVAFWALARAVRQGLSWGRALATMLLGVVLADAWLTLAQAILYNLARAASAWEWCVIAAGVTAPFMAAAFLTALLRRYRSSA